MTRDRVIGKPHELAWHIPEDLQRFKQLTTGNTVIMGLTTYTTINQPLPNRHNIVLSYTPIEIPDVDVCTSIDDALEKARSFGKDIFVMGGASVFEQMLPMAEVLHISHVKKNYPGTVFFPEYDSTEWGKVDREDFQEFTAVTYNRVKQPLYANSR